MAVFKIALQIFYRTTKKIRKRYPEEIKAKAVADYFAGNATAHGIAQELGMETHFCLIGTYFFFAISLIENGQIKILGLNFN